MDERKGINPNVEIWDYRTLDDSIWEKESDELVEFLKNLFDIKKDHSTYGEDSKAE
jgi:hypothetical protein